MDNSTSDTTTPAQDTGEQTSEDPQTSGFAVPDSSDALEEDLNADTQATPTTLPATPTDTDELSAFRLQWKEELRIGPTPRREGREEESDLQATEGVKEGLLREDLNSDSSPRGKSEQASPEKELAQPSSGDKESEASRLYWMGVAAEQSGDMNGAIMYYRQAVQLDPDVEARAGQGDPQQSGEGNDDDIVDDEECESDLLGEFAEEFVRLSLTVLCHPRKATKDTHISALPVEVVKYILRWVASSHCDMRAIEQVSMVCKGFYLIARESQLWKSACKKLWKDCSQLGSYGSWRRMFLLRPHLHFNGVYISKTSYIRLGEHSLDGFYKPYHTVTYFRFLRFFADGHVMYQTTPEEPAQVVGRLCHKHCSQAVLLGDYHVHDRTIAIDLVASPVSGLTQNRLHRGRGKNRHRPQEVTQEQHFHMELLLDKRKSKQLTWLEHYCTTVHIQTGREQVTHFSIDYMYTPFHFSRVKSYTMNSTGMLQ